MIIDKLKRLSQTYQSDEKLYIYLAHGYQDATEEKFAPDTKQAKSILQNNNHILVGYDSLSITKHSHTIFEGYYKGLLKSKQYIELSTNR